MEVGNEDERERERERERYRQREGRDNLIKVSKQPVKPDW